ncbi:MAG: putative beta-lysine N-acetyltransferase, partial [Anoxybacillus ayderensis]|nr:putative beta-lysine N-acetyltransferase [Anoxybacillus ayderensis]
MEQAIQTERFAASVIFDDFNERLRVEDYRGYVPALIDYVTDAAQQKGYTKLIVKARYEHLSIFIEKGFQYEGWIQGYFNGSDAHFLVLYFQQERKTSENANMEDQIVASIQTKPRFVSLAPLPAEYTMRKAELADAEALVNLYRSIFVIYPSPLHDLAYVENVLKKGAMFYVIEHDKQIVSAASAEIN